MREPSRTVGERGYVRHPPPSAAGAVRGRGGAGEPRLSLYSGGAPAVFRNTVCARMCIARKFGGRGATRKEAAARDMYISMRNGGFARVARCVRAMAPALRVHARPYSRVLAGHRKRDCEQLRVACVQCGLCKECG